MIPKLLLLLALLGCYYCEEVSQKDTDDENVETARVLCDAQAGPIQNLYYNSGRWVNIFGDVAFSCSGRLTRWRFYAKSFGTMYLSVWRPVGSESWVYRGSNEIVVTPDQVNTVQTHCIPRPDQIRVRADDVIGIMYPRENNTSIPTERGIIPYENDANFPWPNPPGRDADSFPFIYSRLHNVQKYMNALNLSEPQTGIREFKRKAAFRAFIDDDPCDNNKCQNCGQCVPGRCANTYTCMCPPGFYGRRCERSNGCESQAGPIENLFYNSGRWINVFVDAKFNCSGPVTRWTFYAKEVGNMYLTVWRPNAADNEWTIQGRNLVNVPTANRIYSIQVPRNEQIQARAGDVIGIQYPREDPDRPIPTERGIIPYQNDDDFPWPNPRLEDLTTPYTTQFSRLLNHQEYDDDVQENETRKGLRDFKRKAAFAACIGCPDPCC